jgi:hypothetical protein
MYIYMYWYVSTHESCDLTKFLVCFELEGMRSTCIMKLKHGKHSDPGAWSNIAQSSCRKMLQQVFLPG